MMKKRVMLRCVKFLVLLCTVASFYICYRFYYDGVSGFIYGHHTDIFITAFYTVLFYTLSRVYRCYALGSTRVTELVYSLSLSALISAGIVYVLALVFWQRLLNPIPLLGLVVVQFIVFVIWCICANKLYFVLHKAKPTAIVYRTEHDLKKIEEIKYYSMKFRIEKYIKAPTDIHEVISQIQGYPVVFVTGVNATLRNGIVKYCIAENVQAYVKPHVGDVIMAGAEHMQMFSVPIMRVRRAMPVPDYLFLKRVIDIIVSFIAIIVFLPFMAVTALIIKLYDGGPVLYKQVRLTKDKKKFKILKFRSMRVDAEKDGVARLASEKDNRITPVGKVIRTIRFDELPQLFNILLGDMTIVGPRPERPEIAAEYEKTLPAFELRLQVKAGLTGYAQIYGKYNTEPYDKLQMDLMYINKMSLVEDFRLMFATVKILFMPESTEGVNEGQTTALSAKELNK